MNFYSGSFQLVGLTFAVNKIAGDNRRVLLCPGNDVNLRVFNSINCFSKRSIVIGYTAFKHRSGAEANNYSFIFFVQFLCSFQPTKIRSGKNHFENYPNLLADRLTPQFSCFINPPHPFFKRNPGFPAEFFLNQRHIAIA